MMQDLKATGVSAGLPLRLPCAQLTKLDTLFLEGFADLQMPVASTAAATPGSQDGTTVCEVTAVCMPALLDLEQIDCTMPSIQDLCNLGAALPTGLEVLVLDNLQFAELGNDIILFDVDDPEAMTARARITSGVGDILARLPRLFVLDLTKMPLGASAVEHITAMEQLDTLRVMVNHDILADSAPSTISTGLTSLALEMSEPVQSNNPCPSFLSTIPKLKGLLQPCGLLLQFPGHVRLDSVRSPQA